MRVGKIASRECLYVLERRVLSVLEVEMILFCLSYKKSIVRMLKYEEFE